MKRHVILLGGLALAGCAAQQSASGPTPFDGTYAGTAQVVGFSSPDWQCEWSPNPITVRDGQFHSVIDGAPMTVRIGPDGTFEKTAARPVYSQTKYLTPVHIKGRIADSTLQAKVNQPRCTFNVVMQRQGLGAPPQS
jgi:hypothetical protein